MDDIIEAADYLAKEGLFDRERIALRSSGGGKRNERFSFRQ